MISSNIATLFAETRMAEISMQYRESTTSSGNSTLWIVVILVAVIAIVFFVYRFHIQGSMHQHCPNALLTELCGVHRLNRTGTKLVRTIATEAALAQPALMLLSEASFDAAVEKARKSSAIKPEQNAILTMVRRRFFEEG
ncbi:hypothetical protein CA13_37250 [Planctomycetes bacterium CA13]|uniref:Uncharacterized protein n=1 Tax=Novipirellula herctigrandis TaxID=2527986 RepID=A0A5C5Z6V4_9BACT|nr:hypothetical protein CA13_37250 [Planctomycetes bacterium CA13]